jgi:NAD-dependent deacetylase sirtuin 5
MGSRRILALCGAGLSAASGLDTFRGAGGMWRNHEATSLATPEAFARDPGLVVSITLRDIYVSFSFSRAR